jgi:hypothetical protein
MKTCPTCGRPIPDPHRPKRVCARCGHQIKGGHKWVFNSDGRAQHRICEDPDSYGITEPRVSPQGELLEAEVPE